jgi:hypothetical protein
MMEIELTRGMVAVIDDQDADLAYLKWHAHENYRPTHTRYYAQRWGSPRVSMHRVILERKIGRLLFNCEYTDHINHDTLDNRRSNLRIATNQENARNKSHRHAQTSSKYKGVSWNARDEKWQVYIGIDHKNKFVGYFHDETEAAHAYDNAARKYFNEFCKPNFQA